MREDIRNKHSRVCEYLSENGLDAVLLSRRCNFSWFTRGAHNHVGVACDVGVSPLLVTVEQAVVFANNIEATRLEAEELSGSGVAMHSYPYDAPQAGATLLEDATRGMRIAADAPAAGLMAEPLARPWDRLRWTLTAEEIEAYRSLATDTVAALESACREAEPGMTEWQLAGLLSAGLHAHGCNVWTLLVAADDRICAHRHPLPTGHRAERCFMLVAGAERSGLITSHTRLAHFGPAPRELQDRHAACANVDAALIGATRPGVALGRIFAEAQEAYAAGGFPDEWKRHHQGGSCGYLPRDVKAAPGSAEAALASQAFAWNPTVTGTKCEDTMLCTADGPELLADATDWPTLTGEWKGFAIRRPDILPR